LNGAVKIKWEFSRRSGNIRVDLLRNDTNIGCIVNNIPIATGEYNWKVGAYQGGTAVLGDGYKIKVSMVDNSDDDTSNLSFSIIDPASAFRRTYPKGNEKYQLGQEMWIAWSGGSSLGAAGGQPISAGKYKWIIGNVGGQQLIPSDRYQISIQTDNINPSIDSENGLSDYFSIQSTTPILQLTSSLDVDCGRYRQLWQLCLDRSQ
jgi:hypothetical protein